MKKETLLTIAVVALLLLNFGTLGFLFFRQPPPPQRQGAHRFGPHLVEQLKFDSAQKQEFERLKSAHQEQMRASDRAFRDALGDYFALLKQDAPALAQKDSLQTRIAQIQNDRISTTFQHFQDVKALCTTEQKAHFSDMVPELMQVILPRNDRAGRGRKPGPPPGRN